MNSQHSTVGQTNRSFGMSHFKQQILAEMTQPPQDNEDDRVLDIESKLQMFKITVNKINKTRKRQLIELAQTENNTIDRQQMVNNFMPSV